jgi:antitoxin component of RelBE/YafQ-DinJ toxin-antitoxin module
MKKEATLHIRLDGMLRNQLVDIAEENNEKLSAVIRYALEKHAEENFAKTRIVLDEF